MKQATILRIRKGLNGYPYSVCRGKDGYFLGNFDSLEQIKSYYQKEIRLGSIRFIKETTKYPTDAKEEEKKAK